MGFSELMKQIEMLVQSRSELEQPLNASQDILKMLTDKVGASDPNVTAGIFGEQARFNRSFGTSIAAGGGGVGGSRNFLPLFSAGAQFAGHRMNARNAAEQAKIMQFLKIAEGFGSVASGRRDESRLRNETTRLNREDDFNFAALLPSIALSFANPFLGAASFTGEVGSQFGGGDPRVGG